MICFFTMASNARSGVNSPVLRTHRTDRQQDVRGQRRTVRRKKTTTTKVPKNNSKTDICDNDIKIEVKACEIRILGGEVEGKKRMKFSSQRLKQKIKK